MASEQAMKAAEHMLVRREDTAFPQIWDKERRRWADVIDAEFAPLLAAKDQEIAHLKSVYSRPVTAIISENAALAAQVADREQEIAGLRAALFELASSLGQPDVSSESPYMFCKRAIAELRRMLSVEHRSAGEFPGILENVCRISLTLRENGHTIRP